MFCWVCLLVCGSDLGYVSFLCLSFGCYFIVESSTSFSLWLFWVVELGSRWVVESSSSYSLAGRHQFYVCRWLKLGRRESACKSCWSSLACVTCWISEFPSLFLVCFTLLICLVLAWIKWFMFLCFSVSIGFCFRFCRCWCWLDYGWLSLNKWILRSY